MNILRKTEPVAVFIPPPSRTKNVAKNKEEKLCAGLYCRLSKERANQGNESYSIFTQRSIIKDYAENNGIEVYDTYVDDGYTGTTFDRPGWKRMMADIEAGKINMVIAKDLSRMSRYSHGFGQFLEHYCTNGDLRVVAVTEGIDTVDTSTAQIIEILNMCNSWYPQDISKKTRAAKENSARQGLFTGSYAPFGYQKDPKNKRKLIPSDDAVYVREIFLRVSKGDTIRQIADDFTKRGIDTPSMRINMLGGKHKNRVPESDVWNTSTITNMLNNLCYLGHMEQHKRENIGHRKQGRRTVPVQDRIVVYNTHEPIVEIELWNRVQQIRASRPKVQHMKTAGVNLFSGFVRCSDCGRVLAPINEKGILRCTKYNNGGKSACSSHTIRQDALYEIVLGELKLDAALAGEQREALIQKLYHDITKDGYKSMADNKIALKKLEQKRQHILKRLQEAFEAKNDALMEPDVYAMMVTQYRREKDLLDEQIETLKQNIHLSGDTEEKITAWMNHIEDCLDITELTRSLLTELIDKIVVHEKERTDEGWQQKVEIHYRFIGQITT